MQSCLVPAPTLGHPNTAPCLKLKPYLTQVWTKSYRRRLAAVLSVARWVLRHRMCRRSRPKGEVRFSCARGRLPVLASAFTSVAGLRCRPLKLLRRSAVSAKIAYGSALSFLRHAVGHYPPLTPNRAVHRRGRKLAFRRHASRAKTLRRNGSTPGICSPGAFHTAQYMSLRPKSRSQNHRFGGFLGEFLLCLKYVREVSLAYCDCSARSRISSSRRRLVYIEMTQP